MGDSHCKMLTRSFMFKPSCSICNLSSSRLMGLLNSCMVSVRRWWDSFSSRDSVSMPLFILLRWPASTSSVYFFTSISWALMWSRYCWNSLQKSVRLLRTLPINLLSDIWRIGIIEVAFVVAKEGCLGMFTCSISQIEVIGLDEESQIRCIQFSKNPL